MLRRLFGGWQTNTPPHGDEMNEKDRVWIEKEKQQQLEETRQRIERARKILLDAEQRGSWHVH